MAFAAVDSVRAAATFHKYGSAPKYTDFRKMLDKEDKNIDAVTIAIPDHMHATAAMSAMERGKHVYVGQHIFLEAITPLATEIA